jgi:tryptophanyl-tRNA synthetase
MGALDIDSWNNAIMLSATEDETASLIKKAKTDADRVVTYDPDKRPEVSNLLILVSLCTGEAPEAIAPKIGDGGSGRLKGILTEALNNYLRLLRKKRKELESDPDYIRKVLRKGIEQARKVASNMLEEVREAMNMKI